MRLIDILKEKSDEEFVQWMYDALYGDWEQGYYGGAPSSKEWVTSWLLRERDNEDDKDEDDEDD